jgi:hypothetical protein
MMANSNEKEKEGFDLPKLFLASRVQHVDQGLLFFDNTHLPIQIWSGEGVCALALGDASTNVRGCNGRNHLVTFVCGPGS